MRATPEARGMLPLVIAAMLCACGSDTQTAPVTAGIAFHFCASATPLWMAYQDDGGAWTRSIPDATGLYHAAITNRGGIAIVRGSASSGAYAIYVQYATASELTAEYASCSRQSATGVKALQGSVAGVGASEAAEITMGGVASTAFNGFNISGVVDGPVDLIATRFPTGTGLPWPAPTAIILRRGLNLTSGSTIPVLDFSGAEAFAPATNALTVANLGADSVGVTVSFLTATQTYATLFSDTLAASSTRQLFGVPSAQLLSGDLHDIALVAGTQQSARFFETFAHALSDQTITLGNELAAPTVTIADSATNLRPRVQLVVQPEYNTLVEMDYFQCRSGACGLGPRTVSMVMTATYAGAGFSTWDMTVPDFSKVDGFNATWGLQRGLGLSWDADAGGAVTITELSVPPHDGLTIRDAARVGVAPSSLVASSGRAAPRFALRPRFRY